MRRWILLAFATSVVWACPKDVTIGVMECMGPLEGYAVDQGGILELVSRPDKTSQLCSDGKIQTAFSCLNDLYNRCLRPRDNSRRLDLIIDVGRWSEAMNKICSNIQYFREHADCERKASLEYRPCAEAEMATVSQKLAAVWSTRTNPTVVNQEQKMDAVMKIVCYFSARIRECLRTPFDKYCPPPLTNLLVNTIENFMPPACTKRAKTHRDKGSYNATQKEPYDDVAIVFGTSKGMSSQERKIKLAEKYNINSGKNEAIESRQSKKRRNNGSSQVKGMRLEVTAFVLLFSYFRIIK